MKENNKPLCFQNGAITKCSKCQHFLICNRITDIEEENKIRRLEEEKRQTKCFKCVWANKADLYCPFPKCIEER